MDERADIGVIGGSGLYDLEGLEDVRQVEVGTPFGAPSDALVLGSLDGVRVAFLPRHGRGHRLLPSDIPARANIFALKLLGVRQIVSASAVGSLQEYLPPMDLVVPNQLFDRTKGRPSTFFGDGLVAHVSMADPFCPHVRATLYGAAREVVPGSHDGGTYVCMEGPAFSTRAESNTYRHLGFDIIGMTALPEAKLAREAGICYALLAQVTDFDCWHPDHDSVTHEMVVGNVMRNAANTRRILRRVIPELGGDSDCGCRHALDGAIATAPEAINPEIVRKLAPILEGHLPS